MGQDIGAWMQLPVEQLQQDAKAPLRLAPDRPALYEAFAREIADEIKTRNAAGAPTRLILPVGPIGQFPALAEICNRERISWKSVWTFNMDEYCDWEGRSIPLEHPLSFEGYMRREFFAQLDPELRIPDDQVFFPRIERIDEVSETIDKLGGIDTCYGGIGIHGHVAFNEPPISRFYQVSLEEFRNSRTRVLPLAPETMVMNSIRRVGGNFYTFPPMAITVGMKDILESRRIRLFCDGGDWQKAILRIALLGEVSTHYPATLLQEHPDAMITADADTAAPVTG
jgi:glucosamine-6-phosphate deaminase